MIDQKPKALLVRSNAEIWSMTQYKHAFHPICLTFPFYWLCGSPNVFYFARHESFKDNTHVYLTFEYVQGGEIFRLLRRENLFPNDVALFYITEIVLALEYLHKQKIAYRDLKPENLLVAADGHMKITDFGFAK
mmetsp:Transcript_24701/g.30836  ORF Transcript_24701/g.30836 Transcript_24701/m.30836 type:complete len:134 (+) Transcript_24701:640-1041(+)